MGTFNTLLYRNSPIFTFHGCTFYSQKILLERSFRNWRVKCTYHFVVHGYFWCWLFLSGGWSFDFFKLLYLALNLLFLFWRYFLFALPRLPYLANVFFWVLTVSSGLTSSICLVSQSTSIYSTSSYCAQQHWKYFYLDHYFLQQFFFAHNGVLMLWTVIWHFRCLTYFFHRLFCSSCVYIVFPHLF